LVVSRECLDVTILILTILPILSMVSIFVIDEVQCTPRVGFSAPSWLFPTRT
jgi:hypothetical protein